MLQSMGSQRVGHNLATELNCSFEVVHFFAVRRSLKLYCLESYFTLLIFLFFSGHAAWHVGS